MKILKLALVFLITLTQAQFRASNAFTIPRLPIPKPPSTGGGRFVAGPWQYGSATFYGEFDALETMGGACGYGNLYSAGYGTATAALSGALFRLGFACGQCFQIKCYGSRFCFPGTSTIITGTNLCPPNFFKPSNNGGWCNPPRQHFDMAKPAFQKIANWVAGYVPVMFRRVPCVRSGGMKFRLTGNRWWLLVFITNVGGPGDIKSVSIKGSRTSWITMSRNWGAGYQVFKNLRGQSLSFMVTSYSTGKTVVTYNAAPSNWGMGQIYSGYQLM